MSWDTVQQLLRIVLQIVAGSLITAGYIRAEDAQTLIGAVLSLGGIAWWAFWDRKRPPTAPSQPG